MSPLRLSSEGLWHEAEVVEGEALVLVLKAETVPALDAAMKVYTEAAVTRRQLFERLLREEA